MKAREATASPPRPAPARPAPEEAPTPRSDLATPAFIAAYRTFAHFGVVSIFAALLLGFSQDQGATWNQVGINLALYAAFVGSHLAMTLPWWKRLVWKKPEGFPRERRAYVIIAFSSWLFILAFQRPIFEFGLPVPSVLVFVGYAGFLLSFFRFFHGVTFDMIDGLVAVPGASGTYSVGPGTTLYTEGPYAEVRHPMYRAVLQAALFGLLIHPDLAQVFWSVLIAGTFVAYIPFEEKQLLGALGETYLHYRERTPYRLFKGIW
jgi:protein-S-isoprenylcysteine O-methyltransferase Ste14